MIKYSDLTSRVSSIVLITWLIYRLFFDWISCSINMTRHGDRLDNRHLPALYNKSNYFTHVHVCLFVLVYVHLSIGLTVMIYFKLGVSVACQLNSVSNFRNWCNYCNNRSRWTASPYQADTNTQSLSHIYKHIRVHIPTHNIVFLNNKTSAWCTLQRCICLFTYIR